MNRTPEVDGALKKAEKYGTPTYLTLVAYARELEKLNSARVSERDRFMRKAKESRLRAEAAEKRVKELEAERDEARLARPEEIKRLDERYTLKLNQARARIAQLEAELRVWASVDDKYCGDCGEEWEGVHGVSLHDKNPCSVGAALRAKGGK